VTDHSHFSYLSHLLHLQLLPVGSIKKAADLNIWAPLIIRHGDYI
jgi:hypothetical protein